MFVGMVGLDFYKERADVGTATVVAKLADGLTLTNKTRVGSSEVDYVATSMEGISDVHHPQRDQPADLYANQTELNAKFWTGGFKHNVVAGLGAQPRGDPPKLGSRVEPVRRNAFDDLGDAVPKSSPQGPSRPIPTARAIRSSARGRFTTRRSTRSPPTSKTRCICRKSGS